MCGGTLTPCQENMSYEGLSPRVRGNPPGGTAPGVARRSIPACAGEPHSERGKNADSGVYPRVCGGTRRRAVFRCGFGGLSPRVRGNLLQPALNPVPVGSIPACAGEPICDTRAPTTAWVYPRVCGGTARLTDSLASPAGLSPRVRGNRHGRMEKVAHAGSIPACAGEPMHQRSVAPSQRVYPRVCGGTAPARGPGVKQGGLSPRVRGNPPGNVAQPAAPGSIPACAGEPH